MPTRARLALAQASWHFSAVRPSKISGTRGKVVVSASTQPTYDQPSMAEPVAAAPATRRADAATLDMVGAISKIRLVLSCRKERKG